MSASEASDQAAAEEASGAAVGERADTRASARSQKAARPNIDLDEEIRRANDLAAMSRKMLTAAKNVSRNNRKAKQRLIKKAGKLSPEDLERIAVLKRCGVSEEGSNEAEEEAEAEVQACTGGNKGSGGSPSAAESKRPKCSSALETLSKKNPIFEEIGLVNMVSSSASSAASSSSDKKQGVAAKRIGILLGPRARLPRKTSGPLAMPESEVGEHGEE